MDAYAVYSIAELVRTGPLSRSKLYSEIAAGRLKARKAGRRTVILAQDYQAYFEALPLVSSAAEGRHATCSPWPRRCAT
jgi:hypothetical protein